MEIESNVVDDNGTDQSQARAMLQAFMDNGFDGDDEKTGTILDRPSTEIHDMINGDLNINHDLTIKMRVIAKERGIDLE